MDHTRHSGIFNCDHLAVTLVGAGGIGAMTALGLTKMGVGHLVIYDGDIVAPENMATQLHRLGTEDEWKVEALEKTLRLFSDDTCVYPTPARVTSNMTLGGTIVISAVDSIAARQDIWEAASRGSCYWYIDARMSAEELQRYCVNMNDPKQVEKYDRMIKAETDKGIPDEPCTSKATFYTALTAAGEMGLIVRELATGINPPYYVVHNILHRKLLTLERE
jgi:molybdopterin/thiamine biosynthesis adenylyltransferase